MCVFGVDDAVCVGGKGAFSSDVAGNMASTGSASSSVTHSKLQVLQAAQWIIVHHLERLSPPHHQGPGVSDLPVRIQLTPWPESSDCMCKGWYNSFIAPMYLLSQGKFVTATSKVWATFFFIPPSHFLLIPQTQLPRLGVAFQLLLHHNDEPTLSSQFSNLVL